MQKSFRHGAMGKKAIMLAVVAILVMASAFVGGTFGFMQGYDY